MRDFLGRYNGLNKLTIKIFWIIALVVFLTAFFLFFPKKSSDEGDYQALPDLVDEVETLDEIIEEEGDLLINEKEEVLPETVHKILDVPFIPQAPFAEWDNPIFQDGCEEASSLMVVYWARGKGLDEQKAKEEIIAISNYQEERFGEYRDTSSYDTMERIIKGYFGYNFVEIKRDIVLKDIINEIEKGKAVIIPANGQLLGNPYFTQPGPERHMLVIMGYDANSREFITNDPGTKRGEKYRYQEEILFNAIRDYPTGYHQPIEKIEKVMIMIGRES